MIKKILLIGGCILALASCSSTKNMYSWYNYEDITYKYSKKSTDELQVKLLEEYQKITHNQKGLRGVVPPGLYAEYGFLLYKTGKNDEGLSFLKEEIKLYPESEKYVSRIIKQLEQ
jgi:hypothetical protein